MEIEEAEQTRPPHRLLQDGETSLVIVKATSPLLDLFFKNPLDHCTAFKVVYVRSSAGVLTYPANSSSLLIESHELLSKTKGCWSSLQGEPRPIIAAFATDTNILLNKEQPWFTFKEPISIHRFILELKTETGDLIFAPGEVVTISFEFKHDIALGRERGWK